MADLRAEIEAVVERYRHGGLLIDTWLPATQVLALLAAHPVQDEGFPKSGSNLAQPGSSVQVTTAEET